MSANQTRRRFARIDRLPPYVFNITAELKLAARRRGEDIIDMSMGNPDGATPAHIVAKLTEVAQRPDTHGYSASKGIPRLRRAISHWYKDRYAVDINPETEAIVTIGSKEGLAHLMLATLDRGDTVLVPDPSYPIHIYGAVIAGADIRSVPLTDGVDFFAELEKTIRGSYPKPKMMVLGFPSNPTAQCVELDFFERVVALAKKHEILVVHDLAYADIVFDGWKAPSIMQVPGAKDVAVEFFTLSKSYNMAGWRIGFMVGNADLVHALGNWAMANPKDPYLPPGIPRSTLALFSLAYGLAGFGYIVTATFLPVIARQALPGSVWLDLFWPLFGLGVAGGALFTVRLPVRWDRRHLLMGCYAMQATGVLLAARRLH